MASSFRAYSDPHLESHHFEGEASAESLEFEFDSHDLEPGAVVAVLVESERPIEVEIEGIPQENLSRLDRVHLFVRGGLERGRRIVVRVRSSVPSRVTVTITAIKRHLRRSLETLPCRGCKEALKLALSALLAHLGIPFFDAERVVDMPGVDLPGPLPGFRAEPTGPIPVHVGAPIPLPDAVRVELVSLENQGTGPLSDLFDALGAELTGALRGTLEAVKWVLDTRDRVVTAACERAGLCEATGGAG